MEVMHKLRWNCEWKHERFMLSIPPTCLPTSISESEKCYAKKVREAKYRLMHLASSSSCNCNYGNLGFKSFHPNEMRVEMQASRDG